MPIYEYNCLKCQKNVDIFSGMDEDRSDVRCPTCSGPLTRVFGSLAIVIPDYFKTIEGTLSPAEIGQRLNRSRPSGRTRSLY